MLALQKKVGAMIAKHGDYRVNKDELSEDEDTVITLIILITLRTLITLITLITLT